MNNTSVTINIGSALTNFDWTPIAEHFSELGLPCTCAVKNGEVVFNTSFGTNAQLNQYALTRIYELANYVLEQKGMHA